MKPPTYIIIFVTLLSSVSFLANSQLLTGIQIDSLKTELSRIEDDSNKVMLLDRLSFIYSEINPDSGIYYATSALQLATKTKWKKGIAVANADLGFNHYTKADYKSALQYELIALNIYDELKIIGSSAAMLTNIASLYQAMGNYTMALEYHFKALAIFDSLYMESALASTEENIGNIFLEQTEYAKAGEYYNQALQINNKLKDTVSMARNLGNLGILDSKQGLYKAALYKHIKALEVNTRVRNKNSMQINHANIGDVYYRMAQFDKALHHFLIALKITESLENTAGVAINSGNVGLAYLALAKKSRGGSSKKLLSNALHYLRRAKDLCVQIGFPAPLTEFSPNLSETYSLLGNYQDALNEYKFYEHLKDSIYSVETKVKISELELKRQMDIKEQNLRIKEKEARIFHLQAEEERYLRIIYLLVIGLILTVTICTIVSFHKSIRSLKVKNANQYQLIEERNSLLEDIAHKQSHEIRNHVATILGLSALLEEEDDTQEIDLTIINGIKTSAQQLDAVIKNVAEQKKALDL